MDADADTTEYPAAANGPIAPAHEGADEAGWHKESTWSEQSETTGSVGDYAVGPYYTGRYRKQSHDGTWLVIEEAYFVEARLLTNEEGTTRQHWDVSGQYTFTHCTDPEDPGSTELWSDSAYDNGIHALFLWDYEQARSLAERCAANDQRFTLHWNGEPLQHAA